MQCDKCKKNKYLYFEHVSWIIVCEDCYSKIHQNWYKKDWWRELELKYDWPESDEQYEYYLDILDMIPNEDIVFEIDLDEDEDEKK